MVVGCASSVSPRISDAVVVNIPCNGLLGSLSCGFF